MRAVLPQNSSLQFAFRVVDVVLMGRSPHNPSLFTERDHAIATAAMQRADVSHLRDRLFPSLSGGERQRVHMARVLAQIWDNGDKTARYLLLDEPTSALDLLHQHSTLAIARRLADEQGTGVLVVLHDLNLAALYADRVAVMQSGGLVCQGVPSEVLRSEIIEDVFGIAVSVDVHPANPARPLVITNPFKHRMRGIEHA
jgi:iron complex transport system ATP-binding protein